MMPGSLKAKVQRRLLGVEMTEVEVHMATYSRRQIAHRQYKFDHDGLRLASFPVLHRSYRRLKYEQR